MHNCIQYCTNNMKILILLIVQDRFETKLRKNEILSKLILTPTTMLNKIKLNLTKERKKILMKLNSKMF